MKNRPVCMLRRRVLQKIGFSLAGIAVSPALMSATLPTGVEIRGGWLTKAGGEKHIPHVETSRSGQWLHINTFIKHGQTENHHISSIRIFDKQRIELCAQILSPKWSEPRALFVLEMPAGEDLFAVSECNLHGLWFHKFVS